jgi:ribose/xylose/arabinose/galactoside ABC-type transport system permease subunit
LHPRPAATEAGSPVTGPAEVRDESSPLARLKTMTGTRLIPPVAVTCFVIALVALAFSTVGFVTVANGKAILMSASLVGILAIGQTVIMISGSLFTLSIAQVAAASALLYLPALRYGLAAAIILAIALAVAVSIVQGVIIGRFGANPIIATIAVGSITEGADMTISGNQIVYAPSRNTSYQFITRNLIGIPVSVWIFILLALVVGLVMARTRFGMQLYMLGDNKKAARAAGHSTAKLVVGAFIVAGLCAGVAGLLLAGIAGEAQASLAGNNTFYAIAAALVGGTAVTGGKGSVARTVFGALLIAAVTDLALLRGYSEGAQLAVEGGLVFLTVVLVRIAGRSGTRTA